MLEEKTYPVTIIGSYTGTSAKKGTPYVALELETKCGNFIDWVSFLTDGTQERITKTLLESGFIGKDYSDLSDEGKTIEDLFVQPAKLMAVIEHEEWTNDQGEIKKKAVVKWLNSGGGLERVDHKKAVNVFKGFNGKGKFAEMRKDLGISIKKPSSAPVQDQSFQSDDIPF